MNSKNKDKFSIDLNSFIHVDKKKAWKNVTNTISQNNAVNRRRKLVLFSAVASFVAVIVTVIYMLNEKENHYMSDRESGKNKEIVIYTEGGEKTTLKENNTIVNKEGRVAVASKIISNANTLENITVEVPSGKNYTITLSDETIVVLNANSKIIYPSKFEGSVRKIAIDGEAFFEVKKSDTLFVVTTQGVDIKVYGTKFNVNSYSQGRIETTLICGSVGISINGDREVILRPNQISVSDLNTKISSIKEVQIHKYTAWLSGYFRYDRDSLTRMLKDMTHWYDVDIEIDECNLDNILMTGSFDKNSPIEDLITSIEGTTKLKFIKERGDAYRIVNH